MTVKDWRARGMEDSKNGVPRAGAPSAEGTNTGDEWRLGWDDAALEAIDKDPPPGVREVAEVQLVMRDGGLVLVDSEGRELGRQANIYVEQELDSVKATVTFLGKNLTAL